MNPATIMADTIENNYFRHLEVPAIFPEIMLLYYNDKLVYLVQFDGFLRRCYKFNSPARILQFFELHFLFDLVALKI